MKKISTSIALCLGLAFSAGALANNGALQGSQTIGTTASGEALTCDLLGSNVRVNLSSNVSGYYNCDFANTDIRIGTCHLAGSRAERTVACVNAAAPGDPDDWNLPGCDANTPSISFTDRAAFTATSQGGSVGTTDLGGAECSGANLAGLPHFN